MRYYLRQKLEKLGNMHKAYDHWFGLREKNFGRLESMYYRSTFYNQYAETSLPSDTWKFHVYWSQSWWRKDISAITINVSPMHTKQSTMRDLTHLGLSEQCYKNLIDRVISRKCAPIANMITYNLQYDVPSYAPDIYSVMDLAELKKFWNKTSQQSGVYAQGGVAISSKFTNMESLLLVDNCLNLRQVQKSLLSLLYGGLNTGYQTLIKVSTELQEISRNHIGILFNYPVCIKALHIVCRKNAKHPVEPRMRVAWKCLLPKGTVVVCDTTHEVTLKSNRILNPLFEVTTFTGHAHYAHYSREWSLWLGGKFTHIENNSNYMHKIIIDLEK